MSTPGFRLDRAAERRKDLDYLEAQLGEHGTLLVPVWREQHFLAAEGLYLPALGETRELLELGGELVWLGEVQSRACFALDVSALDAPLAAAALGTSRCEVELVDLRFALGRLDADQAALAFYARALLGWHARTQHCGVCGARTQPRDGGHVRVCERPGCKSEHFPRTDPCVLALVTHGERCLLGRQRGWPRGMYSALAGFVEPGETLEQAVVREVREEAGVQVDPSSLCYAGSDPWPFPASLMIGFRARALGDALAFGDELEDARWVSRAELAAPHGDFYAPPPHTLSGRLIAAFCAETAALRVAR